MSTTTFGVNDTNAVKLWAKELAKAERDSLDITPLMDEDDNSVIQIKKATERGKGDKITFTLRARPTQKGISEGQQAEGNAESLTFYADNVLINELGSNFGSQSDDTIDAQRVPFNLREQCRNSASDWWRDRKSVSFFNQVCGYTPANTESATSGTVYCGLNTVTAPAGASGLTRQIWAGTATNDQGLTSADSFTVALIDKAVEAARTGNRMIRPVMIGGQPKYVMYLAEPQVTALRTNAGTGGWLDIQKTALANEEASKNPIYTGALGEWNTVVLRRNQDVTLGVNSSSGVSVANVRRAVLLGAQAAVCAYGMKHGSRYRWHEALLDAGRVLEVSAWSIWGLKKAVFNSVDHGCLVVSSYSTS